MRMNGKELDKLRRRDRTCSEDRSNFNQMHHEKMTAEAPSSTRRRRPTADKSAAPFISEDATASGMSSTGSEHVAVGLVVPASSAAMRAWRTAVAATRCRVAFRCSSHVSPMSWQSRCRDRPSCFDFDDVAFLWSPPAFSRLSARRHREQAASPGRAQSLSSLLAALPDGTAQTGRLSLIPQ